MLRGDPELQRRVLDSAVTQIPVLGEELARDPLRLPGGKALVVGVLGSLYGGLGVAQAAQNAMNVVWGVPRNSRPNPLLVRARSLQLLATSASGSSHDRAVGAGALRGDDRGVPGLEVLVTLTAVRANARAVRLRLPAATARRLRRRDVLPGSVGAAAGLQLLQVLGGSYVTRVVAEADATAGVFAVVLGLLPTCSSSACWWCSAPRSTSCGPCTCTPGRC